MQKVAVIWKKDGTNGRVRLNKYTVKNQTFNYRGGKYVSKGNDYRLIRGMFGAQMAFYYIEGCPDPLPLNDIMKIKKIGIDSYELKQLFNPFYIKTLGSTGASKMEKVQMVLSGTAAAAAVYAVWLLSQMPDDIVEGVREVLRGIFGA
jgi:hypothetical protein